MSKKQPRSERDSGLPDWADDVTPDDEVMRKFYAPTGTFKPGPISVNLPNIPEQSTKKTPPDSITNERVDLAQSVVNAVNRGSSPTAEPVRLVSSPDSLPKPAEESLDTTPSLNLSDADVSPRPPAPQKAEQNSDDNESPEFPAPKGPAEISLDAQNSSGNSTFEDFARKWKRYLYPGQLAVMRTLYELTFEQGSSECFTRYSAIAASTKMSRRNCINVMNSLVERGFVERLEIRNDATGKGIRLRVHFEPIV